MVAEMNDWEYETVINLYTTFDLNSIQMIPRSDAWIIYKDGYEKQAQRLVDIAKKYGGYLSYKATEEETREIGKLLEYDEASIEDFIRKNYS
jgi:hypothetical protein